MTVIVRTMKGNPIGVYRVDAVPVVGTILHPPEFDNPVRVEEVHLRLYDSRPGDYYVFVRDVDPELLEERKWF
jgi:hypothetical protein